MITNKSHDVISGELILRLHSQSVNIKFPYGGLVWNRPTKVEVLSDGETQSIPIVDVTRIVWAVLMGLTMSLLLLSLLPSNRSSRSKNGSKRD